MGSVITSTNITAADAPLWNTPAHHGPALLLDKTLVIQLYYLDTLLPSSNQGTDLIYDLWKPILLGQVVLTCSIIASCFPFLKFLIDVMETGMVRADGLNKTQINLRTGASKGGGSTNGYFKARGSQFHKGPANSNTEAPSTETPADSEELATHKEIGNGEVFRMQSLRSGAKESNGGKGGMGKGYKGNAGQFETTAYKGSDVESQSSQTHIMRKVEWSLTEEQNPGPTAI
ncbi:uncharacterized protein KY384_001697 [Bacidia gigantensis]|uniref:uncharacterized protein n=1 Tax=Bacidia gigantensis TaxID=2732470 RepID=UPI001D03E162|nr:uncharacterized protein KY384_001697 [Bacidia gigantensis]KAG8533955.1 hypothetical protein KY384_001697 [Bacidia gigantensis]